MRTRRVSAGVWIAVLALLASACGLAGASAGPLVDKDSVVVGVKADQPGLGLKKSDGTYVGFDVDVAKYVARRLGFSSDQVSFTTVASEDRERAIEDGKVDFVVASYSVTPSRKTEVAFAGPYYVAHQDILVRKHDSSIKNVRDLAGKRLCSVTGSTSADRVIVEKSIPAKRVKASSYSECVDKLKSGAVDAVSTDDLILAGFAATDASELKVVNASFTNERYGIGLKKTDVDSCEEMNRAITAMYQDGTASKLLTKWFGDTNLRLTTSVPQFEGCT